MSAIIVVLVTTKRSCFYNSSLHLKTAVIFYLLNQQFLLPTPLTSILTPETWFMFCFYPTFVEWTSPRIDFLKYHNKAAASGLYVQVEVTSTRTEIYALAFQNKRRLISRLSFTAVTISIYEYNVWHSRLNVLYKNKASVSVFIGRHL